MTVKILPASSNVMKDPDENDFNDMILTNDYSNI